MNILCLFGLNRKQLIDLIGNIYTLSYNDRSSRLNHFMPGDRVVSMFQYADHKIFYNHNSFDQVFTECPVLAQDQTSWVYGYYAYREKSVSLISYQKQEPLIVKRKLQLCINYPNTLDNLSHIYLWFGEGSYREKDNLSFQPYLVYLVGVDGIQSKSYKYSDYNQLMDYAFDQDNNIGLIAQKVNGHQAYGLGLWVNIQQYMLKVYQIKTAWLELTRFTIVRDNKDYTNLGDRTQAILIESSYYHFTTYNNIPTMNQNIDYNDQLQGQLNSLYFSYSISRSQATGFVKFCSVVFTSITHRPLEDQAIIHFGKQFSHQGFNGYNSGFQVIFRGAGYVNDTDSLKATIKSQFVMPQDKILVATKITFQQGEGVKSQNEGSQYTEWADQYKLEYCMFEWFRYDATPNNIVMILTQNEASYRRELRQVGDRTQVTMLQAREFCNIYIRKDQHRFYIKYKKSFHQSNNFRLWTFIWVWYSWHKREAQALVKLMPHFIEN